MKLNAFNKPKGWIEVICGPMFAGKSEELLRRVNRFKYADISYLIFYESFKIKFQVIVL